MVYQDPDGALSAAIVSATSGVVVNIIGASFVVVHRTTMVHAKDFVSTLERLSAVGMAIQIANGVGAEDSDLRHNTTAAVAKQILEMHSASKPKGKA